MGIVDNIMKGFKEEDKPLPEDYEIDYNKIYTQGEKLYSDWTSGASVFDEKYPDISMFDEGGDWSKDYREASGKELSSRVGSSNPRDSHFYFEQDKLWDVPEGNWTDESSIRAQRDLFKMGDMVKSYGNKPRYATYDVEKLGIKKGNITSPYKFAKYWKEQDVTDKGMQDIYKDFPTEKPY